jgi:hypothetical protein
MKKREAGPAGNLDYTKPGSDQHAAMIGLRKADKEDLIQFHGWTLADQTVFGPGVLESYVREVLRQKVVTLEAGAPPAPQTTDPSAPGFAVPMWVP